MHIYIRLLHKIWHCPRPANANVKGPPACDHILVLSHVCTTPEDSGTLAHQTSLADCCCCFFCFFNSLSASRGSRKNTNTPGQTIKPRHPGLHSHVLEDSPSPLAGMKTSSYLSALPPNNSRRYVTSTMLVISRSKTTSEPVQRQNAQVIISLLICESASFLCASLKKKKKGRLRDSSTAL